MAPGFDYDGIVVATAYCFLDEHGVFDPGMVLPPSLETVPEELRPILAVPGAGAPAVLAKLREIDVDEAGLQAFFFAAFMEDDWPESGTAMLSAIQFIDRTLEGAAASGSWALLFVG